MSDPHPLDERTQRILDVAMDLAEQDGFHNVRLRDLAQKADVALGTVYRRFSCKEDILAAALELQMARLSDGLRDNPIQAETPEDRLEVFFDLATRGLLDRPKLAGAMLRTVASGEPALAERVMRYHGQMTEVILHVHRGVFSDAFPSPNEQVMAHLLQSVWFASLVGWTGGLHSADVVREQMRAAIRVVSRGLELP